MCVVFRGELLVSAEVAVEVVFDWMMEIVVVD